MHSHLSVMAQPFRRTIANFRSVGASFLCILKRSVYVDGDENTRVSAQRLTESAVPGLLI